VSEKCFKEKKIAKNIEKRPTGFYITKFGKDH